jgi:UDP-4-amino-4,6-dideoxy-N-acetyl-beta-L-altrosamine N-acetyltransferase
MAWTMIDLVNLAESHLAATRRWVIEPGIRDGLLIDREISEEEHLAWFATIVTDTSQRVFAAMADGRHIGNFGYRNLFPRHRTGEFWMLIGPEHQGQHLGFPLLCRGLALGFGALTLRKIFANACTANTRAIALYARAGFRVEGILHAEQIYRGQPVDILRIALLADAFVDSN